MADMMRWAGLAPAPILLSEGVITNPQTNAGYGLVHIEARHGKEIRNAGYPSVVAFIEEVARHYDVIREGINRAGEQTYMLQLTDRHNNTLMVELSGDGTYYNINTAGIFKTSYGRNRREVYNRHTTANQSTESGEASQGEAQSGTTSPSRMNATTPSSSEDKGSKSSSKSNEKTEKGADNQKKREDKYLMSDARMEELKKCLRAKLGQLNMGIDPEIIAIGSEMAVGYIERGTCKFADYKRKQAEWQENLQTAQAEMDYWNSIKQIHDEALLKAKQEKTSLTDDEVVSITDAMKANAVIAPTVEINDANWKESVDTPIGTVKMGKNQKAKLFAKGREQQYGMLLETLSNPDVVLEEKDKEQNMFHERPSSYLFVKTFQKEDGSKYVHFESVTVSQDGMEVSISSHIIRESQLENKLKSDRLLYKATALDAPANTSAEQPIVGGSLSSAGKDRQSSATKQVNEDKSTPTAKKTEERVSEYNEHVLFKYVGEREDRGNTYLYEDILYNGKEIGRHVQQQRNDDRNPLAVLQDFHEVYLLEVPVSDYDPRDGNEKWTIGGKEIKDTSLGANHILFENEEDLIDFYEKNKDEIEDRRKRADYYNNRRATAKVEETHRKRNEIKNRIKKLLGGDAVAKSETDKQGTQEKQEAGAENADGVRHRQGGDFAPMSKEQGEALIHELEKTGLAGASVERHEDFIKGLEQRQGARFSEEKDNVLTKASDFIHNAVADVKKYAGKSFDIPLPEHVEKKVKQITKGVFNHHISANSLVHILKNHGLKGKKITENSIPLRDEDLELIPYIMIAPDNVVPGNGSIDGRTSVRFEKRLSNGVVVVVEKEYKNSPQDMETITMWAETSSNVSDARTEVRPLNSTSKPAKTSIADARTVTISSDDVAKIHKDGELAMTKAHKNRYQVVYHGSGAEFTEFDHSHMGEGEGLQAHGWGTYVAVDKNISNRYANSIAQKATYQGKTSKDWLRKKSRKGAIIGGILGMIDRRGDHNSLEEVISDYRKMMSGSKVEDVLNKLNIDEFSKKRNLYTVDIPDNNGANYIEEDGNVETVFQKLEAYKENLDKNPVVRKRTKISHEYDVLIKDFMAKKVDRKTYLEKAELFDKQIDEIATGKGNDAILDRDSVGKLLELKKHITNGKEFYSSLKSLYVKEADKAASEFLHRAGFAGIHYNGEIDGECYVIFNDKDLKITHQERFMRKGDGTIYGYFDEQGVAHFDESVMNGNTAIHEFGHPWQDWCKRTNPKLYERGVELINESPYMDEVRTEAQDPDSVYYGMSEEQIVDEAIARAIGDKGEKMLEKHGVFKFAQLRDWLVGLWQSLKQKFGVGLNENLEDMTLDEFTTIASRDILGGEKLHDKATGTDFTHEELSIIDTAKRDGTHMKAPNGKPTKLTEKQWAQVRTKAFKEWFGDWEKNARIEKLRKAEPIKITGKEHEGKYELNRDSAKAWIKANIKGEYINKDTNEKIVVSNIGVKEVTSHGERNEAHLKSLIAIPELISNSIFVEEIPNTKEHDKYDSYRYYVCGLNIGGVDYTAKVVIGVKGDSKYYDHRLTEIEKGTLINNLNGLSNTVAEKQNTLNSVSKDKRLVSILQTNCSKVVDENGEPMVVYHGTLANGLHKFNKDFIGSRYSYDDKGFFFISRESIAKDYATSEFDATKKGEVIPAFISLQNPLVVDAVWCKKNGLGSNVFKDNDVIEFWDNYQSLMIEESEGKDGVVITDGTTAMVVVFDPTQIKSATSNVGTFDGRNADIRYQQGNSDTLYRMGDDGASFEERRDKAVANKGTVMQGLNEAQVKVVEVPRHGYKGRDVLKQAVHSAIERYNTREVDNSTGKEILKPIAQHYDSHGAKFDYEINASSIKNVANHQSASENVGVHVAVMDKLDEVIGNSIEVEEHPDVLKKDGKREWENGFSDNVLIHRFMGAVKIDGTLYRVKTTMKEYRGADIANKPYTYEVTKIEVLDKETPNTSNATETLKKEYLDTAKLLNGVEKSYEKGKKLLEESKKGGGPRFGYIGYSMSERAHQARMEGRYPKTDFKKAEQDSSKKYRLIEDVKDYVLDLFYRIVGGKSNDTRYTIGTLTAEGREYLQNLTGWDFKPVTKFVLNASDLKHIYNDHFGANEKDPSRNIALNNDDIRNIVDVISNPDRVAHFVDTEHGNRKVLYFFKEAGDGTYNLCEVSSNKKGNLTAKTYYKTKRTAAQRVMDLEQSLLPTSETYFGASPLTGAKIPNLFDMGIADNENFRRNAAENEISVNQTEVDSTKLQSDIDGLVKKMNKTLGLNIVVDDKNDLQDKNDKKAKGWFDTETGEIHLVWNNHSDMTDVERTILHEAVAHKGLRELFGEKFGTFLDNVYRNAEEHIKQTIDNLVSDKGMSRHEATEEYMAGLAEDTNFEQVKHTTWWAKVKSWFADMLHKLGFENFVTAEKIGNNELRYVLWRSYENLKSGGLHGIFAKAEDMAKQQNLKVGDYAEEAVRYREQEETGQEGEPVKPKGEAEEGNFLKDYNAGDATFEEAITEGLLSVAGKHKEDIKARVQATEAIGGQLSKLNRAMRVQKKYDKATVDHIIRLARTILTNGGLDKLTHGEVKRLLSYINKSVGKEAITTQARQVLDLLTEHQLKVCRDSLNQLLRIKGKKVNQQGVEVQAGLDVKGQRMLETARAGIALDIDTLEQRMAEAQEKMGSDLAVEAENASIDYEGLMIARHYHELIKDSKEEEKRAFLEILPSYILRLLMQPLNSMTGCAQAG